MARMAFAVILAPQAVSQLKALRANVFAEVRDTMDRHLRHEPTKLSKSRIRELRGLQQPRYRLRVGEIRVYYDVVGQEVHVLAVLTRAQAGAWLKEKGVPHEEGGTSKG